MKLDKAARVLERRRNYLRAEVALQGDDANSYDRQELSALDEVLVALYDIEAAPRAPGVSSRVRDYRYVSTAAREGVA